VSREVGFCLTRCRSKLHREARSLRRLFLRGGGVSVMLQRTVSTRHRGSASSLIRDLVGLVDWIRAGFGTLSASWIGSSRTPDHVGAMPIHDASCSLRRPCAFLSLTAQCVCLRLQRAPPSPPPSCCRSRLSGCVVHLIPASSVWRPSTRLVCLAVLRASDACVPSCWRLPARSLSYFRSCVCLCVCVCVCVCDF
jgi:hypothetical protein